MAVNRDVNGADAASQLRAYEFGPYRLEPSTRRLLRSGAAVPLTPKAFDTLLVLVERHDRVVEKAELMRLVWADSFVEEANVSQTIFVLRKTLGETGDGGNYIDTVPRHGYRFAASVGETIAKPAMGPQPKSVWRWRAKYAAASAGLVAGLLLLAARWMPSQELAPRRIESLVVLPFDDFSDENRPEPLADSMTDALITKLGQIGGLRVISRTSAITYTNTSKTVPQIARELNVDAVVEGTMRRSSGRVRLNLKLIHGPTDRMLWAETYEGDAQSALELHNDIARAIVSRTSVTLTARESERLAETTRVSPQVYEAYLKGRYFWNRRSEPDMRQAIKHFEEAIRHDSEYAPAYAGLADCTHSTGRTRGRCPGTIRGAAPSRLRKQRCASIPF